MLSKFWILKAAVYGGATLYLKKQLNFVSSPLIMHELNFFLIPRSNIALAEDSEKDFEPKQKKRRKNDCLEPFPDSLFSVDPDECEDDTETSSPLLPDSLSDEFSPLNTKDHRPWNQNWDKMEGKVNKRMFKQLLFITSGKLSEKQAESLKEHLRTNYKENRTGVDKIYYSTYDSCRAMYHSIRDIFTSSELEKVTTAPMTNNDQPWRYSPFVYPDNVDESDREAIIRNEESKCSSTRNRNEAAFRSFFYRFSENKKTTEVFICPSDLISYFLMRAHQFPAIAYKRFQLHPGSITDFEIDAKGRVKTKVVGERAHIFTQEKQC